VLASPVPAGDQLDAPIPPGGEAGAVELSHEHKARIRGWTGHGRFCLKRRDHGTKFMVEEGIGPQSE
jgi:hypothetical protein